jgi:hypothetical protein
VRDDVADLFGELHRGHHGEQHEERDGTHRAPSVTEPPRRVNDQRSHDPLQ